MFKLNITENIKNLIKGCLVLIILIVVLGFGINKLFSYQRVPFPPIIMYDNTCYFTTGDPIEVEPPQDFIDVGKITSSISSLKSPIKNFECNFESAKNATIFANSQNKSVIYIKYDNKSKVEYEPWKTHEQIQLELDERNKLNENSK